MSEDDHRTKEGVTSTCILFCFFIKIHLYRVVIVDSEYTVKYKHVVRRGLCRWLEAEAGGGGDGLGHRKQEASRCEITKIKMLKLDGVSCCKAINTCRMDLIFRNLFCCQH